MKKFINYKLRITNKGQILPLVALTVLVLSMFSFLVWNLGMLEFNRQKMQTAADAAALSGARCRAAFLNKMGMGNIGCHAIVTAGPFGGWMLHNYKKGYMWKKSVKPYQAFINALKAVNQGGGGGPYLTAGAAAKANGADSSGYGSFIKGGTGTGMKGRKMKFLLYIKVGKFPIPAGFKTFNPAYYCRTWENGYRKAQPKQEFMWTVQKKNQTFASSLIGLKKPAEARAVAQAKVWLNVRENAFAGVHNGGFPRNKSEGIWGLGEEPMACWPQFDARLVPVRGVMMH